MQKRRKDRNSGVPDLSQLRDEPEVYFEKHRVAVEQHDFKARVMASWGLIARGVESIPYLHRMLESESPDAREDAAGAYGWMARNDPSIVDHLLDALDGESDLQVVDSLVSSLGQIRDRRAIGPLAQIVLSPSTDGDTRHTAIQSLARIARRRFDKAADPRGAATAWLASHGYIAPQEDEER